MAQPIWVTPVGSLGTIPEGVFFQVPLEATSDETVHYRVIAGELPSGIQCTDAGVIAGVPTGLITVDGAQVNPNRDITSRFTVRAYTLLEPSPGVTVINRLADRTFSLVVTGLNAPEFITPAGSIGIYYDGTLLRDLQIEYSDPSQYESIVIRLYSGELPPGLSVSPTGVISGYITPNTDPLEITQTYDFILEITDGRNSNIRSYSIVVNATAVLTADTTLFTADTTELTADASSVNPPVMLTTPGSLGDIRSDNFYAFQFVGIDPTGADVRFDTLELLLPPGLSLDPITGWLYGYIPNQGLTQITYSFDVVVSRANYPDIVSQPYAFSITIIGAIDTDVIWITPSDLGSISTGATSLFFVEAVTRIGIPLEYKLESGSNSVLPQGLELLPSGNIAGRVSFDCFVLDGNTTTFDVDLDKTAITRIDYETMFDRTFNFTVEAYGNNGQIDVFKDFSITIVRAYDEPYENLYIQAMPTMADRDLVNSLLQDQQIIPESFIFRPDDFNFGRATQVIYDHAFGLTSATLPDYVAALELNHYWKNLVLGQIETAQALDVNGNVIYEVVYSRVIDNLVSNSGESAVKELPLPYPVTNADGSITYVVYPNALVDMRDQVIDSVGQISNTLPRWMLSKQTNGTVLGFVPAWVICYTNPGRSGQVAYNIQQQFGNQLNKVNFKADRYELDRLLSINWDSAEKHWVPQPPNATTFDLTAHYNITDFVGGTGYAVGDQILIPGSELGGTDDLNDLVITVNTVSNVGHIMSVFWQGSANDLLVGSEYSAVAGTNLTGTGTSATWDLTVVVSESQDPNTLTDLPVPTVFDGNSLRFIVPVDMYTNTDAYNRYLLFPKKNILENLSVESLVVDWVNNQSTPVSWTNNDNDEVTWSHFVP